ncbi:MAG: hypothetical protein EP344_13090 [Bacteroidetes bacterium]|nr:MAG: hypothetical protein EP344_13090 [Bacteroidota bacterium]
MNHKPDIPLLLHRYWEGETTLDEERALKAFFAQDPVPEQYQREARLFRALAAEQAVRMPARATIAMPSRRFGWYRTAAAAVVLLLLSAGLWWWNAQPEILPTASPVADAGPLEIRQPQREEPVAPVRVQSDTQAPGIVLHAATPRKKKKKHIQPVPAIAPDTYEDPEQALAEIKAALALVSSKINRSKKTMEKGLQEVDHIDILFKKKKEKDG